MVLTPELVAAEFDGVAAEWYSGIRWTDAGEERRRMALLIAALADHVAGVGQATGAADLRRPRVVAAAAMDAAARLGYSQRGWGDPIEADDDGSPCLSQVEEQWADLAAALLAAVVEGGGS
jgi:hypothetical protein